MGTQNQGFGSTWTVISAEDIRMKKQQELDIHKSIEERRKLGQFATPITLADEIVSYGLKLLPDEKISFLEPSIGTGAFFSALLSNYGKKELISSVGYEVDNEIASAATTIWKHFGLKVYNKDYTREIPSEQHVNFLICNPPYVRHQLIPSLDKIRLNSLAYEETGHKLSGLAGLYCYFLLLSHKWLAPGAICGWLIPSEFMDVNYGDAIKSYLLNDVHLLRIHRYDPHDCQFQNAMVSSTVVWFKNEHLENDYDVELSYGSSHEHPEVTVRVKQSVLHKERKWTRFPYLGINKNEHGCERQLGDYFEIKRGLATGDNSFFILTRNQINELGLDMSYFIPILPSPRNLKTDEVPADKNGFPIMETQYFLLNCTQDEDEIRIKSPSLWRYLQSGKETTSKKYLCRNRKIWYLQEKRIATPFLCSYMGRGTENKHNPFRFVLNHSSAIATNSYLMLYPKKELAQLISDNSSAIYQIWNMLKSIDSENIQCEGRVYGGGLRKIEPKELARVKCEMLLGLG